MGFTTPDENELINIKAEVQKLRKECVDLEKKKVSLSNENDVLSRKVSDKKQFLIEADEAILLQDFALYKPKYNFQKLESFNVRLKNIRAEQKYILKKKEAVEGKSDWTVNGSLREGRKMIADVARLLVRAFNVECDSLVEKVKFNNLESYEKRMRKSFEMINRNGKVLGIHISEEYLNLKLDELLLSYEYALKKQNEKEEMAEKRAQMREEQKAIREIEAEKQKLLKEEIHFQQAIDEKKKRLYESKDKDIQLKLIEKIKELEAKLALINKDKADILNREQNTRAGYVYIISNIGAFGKDVYKIGVTRRLDPMERVRELGDASVPFKFDVHAFIFSDDAPALENELHKTFEDYRLNKLNKRREFFKVPLKEIEEVVKKYHSKEVEFEELAYAEEYRQSLKMEK